MAHCWRPKILGAVRNVSLSAFEGLFRCCFFVEPFFLLGAGRGGALGSLRFVNCCGMGHDMPCPIFAEDLDAEATNFDTKIAEWVHGQSLLHVHVDAFLIFCIFLCSFQIVPPRLFEASSTCQVHCLPTSFGGSCSTCAALDDLEISIGLVSCSPQTGRWGHVRDVEVLKNMDPKLGRIVHGFLHCSSDTSDNMCTYLFCAKIMQFIYQVVKQDIDRYDTSPIHPVYQNVLLKRFSPSFLLSTIWEVTESHKTHHHETTQI